MSWIPGEGEMGKEGGFNYLEKSDSEKQGGGAKTRYLILEVGNPLIGRKRMHEKQTSLLDGQNIISKRGMVIHWTFCA